MTGPVKYYKDRLGLLIAEEHKLKKKISWLTFLRLFSFLGIFPSVFILVPRSLWPGIILTFIILIIFLTLIKFHQQLNEKLNHIKALTRIIREELLALDYHFDQFDPGDEFTDTSHFYSFDMDLFGNGSLFQFINRTVTCEGRQNLAHLLSCETLDHRSILARQEAVKELSLNSVLTEEFRAAGSMDQEEYDTKGLYAWLESGFNFISRKSLLWIAWIIPLLTITAIFIAILNSSFTWIFITLYLLQLMIIGMNLSKTSREHDLLSKRLGALKKIQALFSYIEKGNYSSESLSAINTVLNSGDLSASASIRKLARIVSAFDNRLNIFAAIFLEGILLWDIQCMIRLERWKKTDGINLGKWIDVLGDFDALASLSSFAFNHPDLVYPVPSDQTILRAKQAGHILIPDHERVSNDFAIEKEGGFVVITGANMAGKSTFLRTITTNLILAMSGAPVCAVEFMFRPLQIFSSMRTSDSLNKHESYFYAELYRLKQMIDMLKDGRKLFIILDEILKGTNSRDKEKGSQEVMHQLMDLGGTGILATHDLNLANIEKDYPGRIKNMCFEISIDQAEISFDYKLREGITTKMNALLLMQQMGLIKG